MYEGHRPSEKIYSKSTQGTQCWKVHSLWVVTTLSLIIGLRVYSIFIRIAVVVSQIWLPNGLFSHFSIWRPRSGGGEHVRIYWWNLARKNRRDGATVRWKFHNSNDNHSCDVRQDRRTDERAIAYSALSIHRAVEKKWYLCFNLAIISVNIDRFNHFHCYNKKCRPYNA